MKPSPNFRGREDGRARLGCRQTEPKIEKQKGQPQATNNCKHRKKKTRRSATGRREAARLFADVRKVLRARADAHRIPDLRERKAAATAMIRILLSAKPGRYRIGSRWAYWRGSEQLSELAATGTTGLDRELTRLGYETPVDVIDTIETRVAGERERAPGAGYVTGKHIGEILGLTASERAVCGAFTIRAVDESEAERMAAAMRRRLERDRERKAAMRAAAGSTPRAKAMERTQPWVALGISRRTYFRLKERTRNGTNSSANDAHEKAPQPERCGTNPSAECAHGRLNDDWSRWH